MKTMRMKNKIAVLLTVLLVLAVATASVTLALLADKTDDVENTFTPSEVTCDVVENFDGKTIKSDVQIANTGNTDAFIRAAIVVTWQKTEGEKTIIADEIPKIGVDYTMDVLLTDDGWFKMGDYYYYQGRVTAETGLTSVLVKKCEVLKQHPEGYRLCVEIIADAIQADGVKAGVAETADQPAEIAWGVVVNNKDGKAVSIAPPAAVIQ